MPYELRVAVYGTGDDPNHRSHWGFMISQAGSVNGELLHVKLLDMPSLRYQFEERVTPLKSATCQGFWKVAQLSDNQRLEAKKVIQGVKAPADGKKRCQDWVFNVFIDLEVEGLISAGFSQRCKNFIGKPAKEVASGVGSAWAPAM